MIRRNFLPTIALTIGVVVVLAMPAETLAQGVNVSLFSSYGGRQRPKNSMTKISADSMDIDISKNLAVFTGNVLIDDPQLVINCHKMEIVLDQGEGGDIKSKTISKIVCKGDVVIIRKLPDAEVKEKGAQKAIAGEAEYEVKTGKVTLSEKPMLMRGDDSLKGRKITFWRDSNRLMVEGGGDLELRSGAGSGFD